ncbi:hypothetical protein POVWA2_046930 [Plasmodium ovale wallikeri]|uniref:Uncharacterized protein n=1 Tax=Plasmodium ovale wallikeri TaxID=864142 RepID=A0A1A8ZJ72_PLAOA|nr:hypothetical protein POVWA1_047990 [Plasmodium ovale wallikeri]SBT43937.1 hypothetical protein POVWA2_046930 [Plasmodium ovale wallikeri]
MNTHYEKRFPISRKIRFPFPFIARPAVSSAVLSTICPIVRLVVNSFDTHSPMHSITPFDMLKLFNTRSNFFE